MTTTNTDIAKKLDELVASFGTFSENVTVRLNIIEQNLYKLNEAMYGNGMPGIKEKMREHEKRIGDIEAKGPEPVREVSKALSERLGVLEQTHAVCPIVRIDKAVTEIEKRHNEEDEIIQDAIEDREQEEDSARKFRWESLALAVGLILNLIISLVHEFIK